LPTCHISVASSAISWTVRISRVWWLVAAKSYLAIDC